MGRIGRVRYLTEMLGATAVDIWIGTALAESMTMGRLTIAWVLLVAFRVLRTVPRLQDMGVNGWFSLLVLIPFVWLIPVFWPGTKGQNKYGPPPKTMFEESYPPDSYGTSPAISPKLAQPPAKPPAAPAIASAEISFSAAASIPDPPQKVSQTPELDEGRDSFRRIVIRSMWEQGEISDAAFSKLSRLFRQ